MTETADAVLDTAIVGGGISGLYVAWRLARADGSERGRIGLFECTDRLGGRLWSMGLGREKAIPADLGGMFFSDSQPLVYGLCTRELGLATEQVNPKPDFAYLRGVRFRMSDFAKPDVAPYRLAEDERGKPYHELILMALRRIVPELDQYWPLNADSTFPELVTHLREAEFQGRKLHQWGFWNLLSRVLSNEAYLCLRDVVGSYALLSNWNGHDACLSLLSDLKGQWHKLTKGYEDLPRTLARHLAEMEVPVHLRSTVRKLEDDGSGVIRLSVESDDRQHTVQARNVVLALPGQALQALGREGPLSATDGFGELLGAIDGVPACKIFLTFDDPWWRRVPEGPGKVEPTTFAASHTDLPMRQCYYLGVDPHSGEGLVLASYADAQSVNYWSSLMTDSGRRSGLLTAAPPVALEEIRRQLSVMHGVEVPAPRESVFVNWAASPFGAGWHEWRPGWESHRVMAELRRPDPDLGIYVCGEAASAYQGWVEGALTSAEVLLQEEFGMPAPDWLASSDCLAPYRL